MKADTWMAFYVGDYMTDTMHLTTRQHGAYLLLIIAAWKGGGWLTGSDTALMAITKLSPKEWQQDAPTLLPFFAKDGDRLRHNRVAFEWNEAQRRTADKSRAGRAGASKRWHGDGNANGDAMATPLPKQSQVDAHLPSQLQEPVTTTNRIERENGAGAPCASEDAEIAFAEFMKAAGDCGWPKPRGLEPDRRKKLKARLAEHGLDGWRLAIAIARESEFLRTKFPLKLDWVLEPRNFRKVLEGNYGSSEATPSASVSGDEVLWEARFRNYHPGGLWQEATWGPRPESGRCHAPKPVVERWRGRVAQ